MRWNLFTLCVMLILLWHDSSGNMVSRCPEGWKERPGSEQCYLVHAFGKERSFDDCRYYCQARGGDLIKLEDVGIRDWILAEIAATGLVGEDSVMWVGAHNVSGSWEWIEDYNPIDNNILPWDDASGEGNCAALTMSSTLLKLECETRLRFICHRWINIPPPCDFINGWESLHQHCYLKSIHKDSWHDAKIECEIGGGYLLTINGSLEQQYATDLALDSHDQVWIGLTEEGHPGNFTWIQDTDITYQHWEVGQPDLSYNGYGAVVVDHNEVDGRWVVERSTQEFYYICKKKQGACVYGWEEFRSSCYYFNMEAVDVLVWSDARANCQSVGGELIVLDDEAEDVFIRSRLPEAENIWIGLYSEPGSDLFWVDGTTMGSKNFTHMSENDINTALTTQMCSYLTTTGGVSSWVPVDCTLPRYYACEIPVGKPITLIPPPANSYCPEFWVNYNDYCYLFNDQELTWTAARQFCQNSDGDLASVTSWGEQDYIHNNQKTGGSWIGFNDRAQEGVWTWSDNNGVIMTNWNDGEPNGSEYLDENCAEMLIESGKWNDIACDHPRSFICRRKGSDKPIEPPTPTTPPPDWSACGWDWTENPTSGECYRLELMEMTFQDSSLHCRELGQGSDGTEIQLVSLTTSQEQSFIQNMVYNQHLSATSVWIGMKNDVDGNRWIDGTPVTFFNYADGEPNGGGYSEPCVEMYTNDGNWNDVNCGKRLPFICEKKGPNYKPILPPPPPPTQCPDGWKYFNNHCYYISPDSVNFETANSWCQNNLGSQLVSIHNAEENQFLTDNSQSMWVNFWLGLRDDDFGNNWHWLDGSSLDYTNWIPGEPNNQDGLEHCGEIRGTDFWGQWNDFPCNNENHFVCRITIKTCPQGFTYHDKKCYYASAFQEPWDVARDRCKDFNVEADLVSLHSDEENNFFGEVLTHSADGTWIGFRYDNNSQTWSWSDGQPNDYLHWNNGEPNLLETEFCAEVIDYYGTETHALWNNLKCSEARNYGCEFFPTHTTGCEDGWTFFNDYCYYYSNIDGSYSSYTFNDAEDQCNSRGGHLASVHSSEENDFLFSLLGYDYYSVWIGVTDYGDIGNIRWTDGSSFSYSKWGTMYSSPFAYSPACASIYYSSLYGMWSLDSCTYSYFYICKKPVEPRPINPVDTGCNENDEPYKGSCYSFPEQSLSWIDSKLACEANGANLIAINDRFEGAFISAFLGELGTRIWIGLNGTIGDDGSVTFVWVTGEPVEFTNWDEFEPNPEHGTCVTASGDSATPGLWTVWTCADVFRYICEYPRNGYNPNTPPPTEPPGVNCAIGWHHKGGKCYKVYKDPLSWGQAELFCGAFGAHLTSVNTEEEEAIIKTLPGVAEINATYRSLWVGLELGSDSGYHWTDGSAVSFINWADGQPSSQYERDTCGSADKNSFKLSISNCNGYLPYICEAGEGNMHTTIPPPTPPQVITCTDDPTWYLFNDHCYKFISETNGVPQTWWTSHRMCRDEGGELASIHSVEENYWIESMLTTISDETLWIGGRSTMDMGYEWMDGTPFDFDNWYIGEPNNMIDQEDCIGLFAHRTGYWNDQNCAHLEGRICKRPHGSTHPPPETTPFPDGHCPEGWAHMIPKCLKFFANQSTYEVARAACKALHPKSDLISIHNSMEQAHMMAGLGLVGVDVWTGLRLDNEYVWVDQTAVTFTNWAPGEPNGGSYGELCVEAYRDTGMWNDVGCDYTKGYVCQMPQDPSITEHNPPKCGAPYDGYIAYNGACYKVVGEGKAWQDAEKACSDEGAHLASAHDLSETSFLWTMMTQPGYKSMWIGLNNLQDNKVFKWSDGWPVFYTHWASSEPNISMADYNCVELLGIDGTWRTLPCSVEQVYTCKFKNGTVPTPDPPTTGYCPDDRWLDLGGGYCYLIVNDFKTWNDANTNCMQESGNLVSVHSESEMNLIKMAIKNIDDPLWIGFIQKKNGFGWSDSSAVDFINWESGEPNTDWEQCAEVYTDRGTWNDITCDSTRPSICKVLKQQYVEPTDATGGPPVTTRRPGVIGNLSGGAIFGIVVAILVLMVGVGFVGYSFVQKKKGGPTLSGSGSKSDADKVNFSSPNYDTEA